MRYSLILHFCAWGCNLTFVREFCSGRPDWTTRTGPEPSLPERDNTFFTRLSEELPADKRLLMLDKLLSIMDQLWIRNSNYQGYLSVLELYEVKRALAKGYFKFSPMFRSEIPKENKPGKFRPITKPVRKDRLVMDALSILLNLVLEDRFLPCSHGFRKGRARGDYLPFTSAALISPYVPSPLLPGSVFSILNSWRTLFSNKTSASH